MQLTLTAVPHADPDADADPDPNPGPNPDPNPDQLHVEFSYEEAVIDACRGFAGAHYDAGGGWRVPMRHREALERRLAALHAHCMHTACKLRAHCSVHRICII